MRYLDSTYELMYHAFDILGSIDGLSRTDFTLTRHTDMRPDARAQKTFACKAACSCDQQKRLLPERSMT